MSEKLLVTGFDRFGPLKRPNITSEVALPAIADSLGDRAEAIVLPTAYDTAADILRDAIDDLRPAAVVMFGMSHSLDSVRLESFAKNFRASSMPDNEGKRRAGRLVPGAPRYYESTLPLRDMKIGLEQQDIRSRVSLSAGTFVCNEVFYKTMHHLEESDLEIPAGLVHLGSGLRRERAERAGVMAAKAALLSAHP
jgi:pyroglutamyl-peptidase